MTLFQRLALATTALTLCVILLGAYVRLSDAGLGCPDWPGCYGHLDVPRGESQIAAANAAYPERPVETGKAWKEMAHRYLAGALGFCVLALAAIAWRRRRQPTQPLRLPLLLLALVSLQAILGMWTVTWQLKPLVVTAHLLGGMATLSLLWWLCLRHGRYWQRRAATHTDAGTLDDGRAGPAPGLRPWALLGLALVLGQIALGGWTSTNYAALACTDFPTCQARWWPDNMDFDEAFVLWRGLGTNYEFGVLDHPARVAIHVTHRLGALVILLTIGWLSWRAMRDNDRRLRAVGGATALLLAAQIALGISNVWFSLPLAVAVAHNGTAALLLMALLAYNHVLRPLPLPRAATTKDANDNAKHEHPNTTVRPTSALA